MPKIFKLKFKLSMSELRGIILVFLGLIAFIFFYSWWFVDGRWTSPWLALGLAAALFFGVFQILAGWLVYLWTHHRPATTSRPPAGLTVDVFVTVCGEEYQLIERSLAAACAMRGPHRTWLLDDGRDPVLARLAERFGAGYLTRPDRKDAKAGNVNAALARTGGDIIVLFDVDHTPEPDFLEQALVYFADPGIGFVQVMPTFSNYDQGWVARAAVETSLDFYNPTSKGMDGFQSVTKMGSNALIRREALNSIGGYRPGLAEDLATSMSLHAAGWRSRYVAEPLAPGLAPPDLAAWFTQQLKWSRGVFEVLLTAYPRLFHRLRWGDRLAYAVRTTKYLIGPVIFVHLALVIAALMSASPPAQAALQQYFIHLTPFALLAMIIQYLALRKWRHPSVYDGSLWRALVLVYVTWPVYTLAWIMALLRLPLSFRPTPKNSAGGLSAAWLVPQLVSFILLVWGLIASISRVADFGSYSILYAFALCLALPQVSVLRPLLRSLLSFRRHKVLSPSLIQPHRRTGQRQFWF